MKILHINSYFSTSKFYKNFFDEQMNSKMELNVYVPVAKTYQLQDFEFGEYTKVKKIFNEFDRYVYFYKQYKIIHDIEKEYNIKNMSLIHAHSLFTNGYAALKMYKKYNIPYIVAVRDTDLNLFFKKMFFLRGIGLEILKSAKNIIVLSKPYKDQLLEKYIPAKEKDEIERKISILPNGIDKFWLENKYMPKTIGQKTHIKLIQVGEVSKRKNQLTSLEVVKKLNSMQGKFYFTLTIVGKIKDNKILSRLQKSEYVTYFPHVNKERLLNLYREHDIFIMPSTTETFGLVYAEAMSQALPIIYSKNQGFDKQIDDGIVGFSIESKNCDDICQHIMKILEVYEGLSENAISYSGMFDWTLINDKYYKLYANALPKRM